MSSRAIGQAGRAALVLWGLISAPPELAAQGRDVMPGVAIGTLAEGAALVRTLALGPLAAEGEALLEAARLAEIILEEGLERTHRFQTVAHPVAAALLALPEPDYRAWARLGARFVARGELTGDASGRALYLEVHDVALGRLEAVHHEPLPGPRDAGFRMAVHRASDRLVEQVTGEPGISATRIAFSMRAPGSATKDLYVIDADGHGLRRIASHDLSILSPTWHPSGQRLAFLSLSAGGDAGIFEVDLRTGEERRLPSAGEGMHYGPAWFPSGERMAVTLDVGGRGRIVSYDPEGRCCTRPLTGGQAQDLSPSFSPDGRWMAFTSNRRGAGAPLVYVTAVGGGEAEAIAPWLPGQRADFTAPDWSPTGGVIAYHGRTGRGSYHILVTEFDGRAGRTRQVTWQGNNENPSWAPDGRHLVFVGQREEGSGLFVLDTHTGQVRRLLAGREISTPAWSPAAPRPKRPTGDPR